MTRIDEILLYWFGEPGAGGQPPDRQELWFGKDDATDRELRERFLADHAAVMAGEREGWLESPRGALAYVIVLDQLSRNMFRGTSRMYDGDERAREAAIRAIDAGFDAALPPAQRSFFYLPLMHSESIEHQARCVQAYERMAGADDEVARRIGAATLPYAVQHRDIVARFGRFPHRNALLGRESTPEEIEFLKQPGSSF